MIRRSELNRSRLAPTGNAIAARVFMVGCPRSGTTLLQSLLTAHPQVFSVPESHLYARLTSRHRVLRRLGLVRPNAPEVFAQILGSLGLPTVSVRGLTTSFYLREFSRNLDRAALAANKSVWLEKTPRHLYFVPEIERTLPQAKFIHVLRDGADVVASLFEVTQKYPEIWGGARSLDACIARWNKDVALSLSYRERPNHLLVRYEALTADPEATLRKVFAFVRLPFSAAAIGGHHQASQRIITPGEAWKSSVGGPIRRAEHHKLNRLFSPASRAYILERTQSVWE